MIEKEENQTEETEVLQVAAQDAVLAEEPEKTYEVVGVRYKTAGKIYYFDPQGLQLSFNEHVIVETARGIEYGFVAIPNRIVTEAQLLQTISECEDKTKATKGKEAKEPRESKDEKDPSVPQLRPVLRIATDEDRAIYEENKRKEVDAKRICLEKIAEHHLDMKLLDASYSFDNSKLYFNYAHEGRVDFRELVKSLAAVFKTRIELHQVGPRDETKIVGGLGVCGRPFCCKTYMENFVQVSIKMAKEQNLSLNSEKNSGPCGKLMCCLRYELDTYQEELAKMPKMDSLVETPDGRGIVCELRPLAGIVRVRLSDGHQTIKTYVNEQVKVIAASKKEQKALRESENKPETMDE